MIQNTFHFLPTSDASPDRLNALALCLKDNNALSEQLIDNILMTAKESNLHVDGYYPLDRNLLVMFYMYARLTGKEVILEKYATTSTINVEYASMKAQWEGDNNFKKGKQTIAYVSTRTGMSTNVLDYNNLNELFTSNGNVYNAAINQDIRRKTQLEHTVLTNYGALYIARAGHSRPYIQELRLMVSIFFKSQRHFWYEENNSEAEAFDKLVDELYDSAVNTEISDTDYGEKFKKVFDEASDEFPMFLTDSDKELENFFKRNITHQIEAIKRNIEKYDKDINELKSLIVSKINAKREYEQNNSAILLKADESAAKAKTILEMLHSNPYYRHYEIEDSNLTVTIVRPTVISNLQEFTKRINDGTYDLKDLDVLLPEALDPESNIELVTQIKIVLSLSDLNYRTIQSLEVYDNKELYKHPHLYKHNCFGSYNQVLLDILHEYNLEAFFEQLTEVTSEINVYDSIVTEEFLEDTIEDSHFRTKHTFRNKITGRFFSAEEYLNGEVKFDEANDESGTAASNQSEGVAEDGNTGTENE